MNYIKKGGIVIKLNYYKNKMYTYIIPCYNSELTIERAINSILNDVNVDKIVCVDDCSTDDTLKILKKISKKNSKINILTNEENRGAGYSRNRGIEVVKSEYVAFLDADDEIKNPIDINHLKNNCLDYIYISNEKISKFSDYMPAPWHFIVKKSFLIKNEISFHETLYFEDLYFTCLLFNSNAKYENVRCDYYNYIKRKDSYSLKKTQRIYEIFDLVKELEDKKVDKKVLEYAYQIHIAYFLKIRALLQQDKYRLKEIENFLSIREFKEFKNISMKKKIVLAILSLPNNFLLTLFKYLGNFFSI